jgi:hypothetical protein
MLRSLYVAPVAILLAGCVEPPASELELQSRIAGASKVMAEECSPFIGGFTSAKDLRATYDRSVAKARDLGATEADLAKGVTDARNALFGRQMLIGQREACTQFVSSIAFAG